MSTHVRAGQTWQHAKDYNPDNRLTVYVRKVEGERVHVISADQHTGLPLDGGRRRTITITTFHASPTTAEGRPRRTGFVLFKDTPNLLAEAAQAAERAVADHHHEDLCDCDHWPKACATGYTPNSWASGAWEIGLPAALKALGLDPDLYA
ncbi:hypothetical protein [Nocardiopsis synnemataformans]|uniref:hypothetical protein n=1 Tax=Nocardiopsis synnemataformans TaxID=61305 RepID=UPI003EC08AF8